jgi:DNA-binding transcriptional ArsR family regulator
MSNQNNAFKALSDPTRRKNLQLLKEKDLTAGEIADSFNISKPSISHHLNLLKQAIWSWMNGRDRTYIIL